MKKLIKNNAGPLREPAPSAACAAVPSGDSSHVRAAFAANDARFSTSSEEFTAEAFEKAFPGQSVCAGMPNRMRRAMHCARGLIRAVERNDIDAAIVWMRALHRAAAPIGTK